MVKRFAWIGIIVITIGIVGAIIGIYYLNEPQKNKEISNVEKETIQSMVPSLTTKEKPPGSGKLNTEYAYGAILLKIFDQRVDFSAPAYQVKNKWIHFEAQDGTTFHRHSSGVTIGYLFETVGIVLTDRCFIFFDVREFCKNNDFDLKFYINQLPVTDIRNYVITDGDRILISYGAPNQTMISNQILELDSLEIRR